MDVVPAFCYGNGYRIPNSPDSWLLTHPQEHLEAVSELNRKKDFRFVPLVKMIKYWNWSHEYRLRGFFLEMWDLDIFQYADLPSYPDGIYRFFDRGIAWIDNNFSVYAPGSYVNLMDTFLGSPTRRSTTRSRFVSARDLAAKAIEANDQGDNAAAIAYWKRLFGEAFPAYG